MRIAILSAGRGWHVDDLENALMRRGHETAVLPVHGLTGAIGAEPRTSAASHSLDAYDAVLVRTIPRGSLEQIIFRIDALHRLERCGVPVINSAATIERTVDKYYASCLLDEAGLPTPRTYVAERADDALSAVRELGDVVVKPLFGANGRGIVRISDEEIAHRVFRALELERAVYYVQEFVQHDGRDIRAFVVGDRVVGAIERRAGDWRTNLARGGRAERCALPPEWQALGVRAARAVGADYAGVDLLPTAERGVLVLEVNGIPGWRGLQHAAGTDVADAIVTHLERRVGSAG